MEFNDVVQLIELVLLAIGVGIAIQPRKSNRPGPMDAVT